MSLIEKNKNSPSNFLVTITLTGEQAVFVALGLRDLASMFEGNLSQAQDQEDNERDEQIMNENKTLSNVFDRAVQFQSAASSEAIEILLHTNLTTHRD